MVINVDLKESWNLIMKNYVSALMTYVISALHHVKNHVSGGVRIFNWWLQQSFERCKFPPFNIKTAIFLSIHIEFCQKLMGSRTLLQKLMGSAKPMGTPPLCVFSLWYAIMDYEMKEQSVAPWDQKIWEKNLRCQWAYFGHNFFNIDQIPNIFSSCFSYVNR